MTADESSEQQLSEATSLSGEQQSAHSVSEAAAAPVVKACGDLGSPVAQQSSVDPNAVTEISVRPRPPMMMGAIRR